MDQTDLKGAAFGISLGAAGFGAYGSKRGFATGVTTVAAPAVLLGTVLIAVTANRVRKARALIKQCENKLEDMILNFDNISKADINGDDKTLSEVEKAFYKCI